MIETELDLENCSEAVWIDLDNSSWYTDLTELWAFWKTPPSLSYEAGPVFFENSEIISAKEFTFL